MEALLEILKNITTLDAIKFEESDHQYKSLKNLYLNLKNKDFYLCLIISNSIVCYQLSIQGESYWEEFNEYFSKKQLFSKNDIIKEMEEFIKNSKGNKRFVQTKIKRLQKLKPFLEKFIGNEKFYYENMLLLLKEIANIMNQKTGCI